jgi:uncharacterized protein YjbI with pentapeptide repeats
LFPAALAAIAIGAFLTVLFYQLVGPRVDPGEKRIDVLKVALTAVAGIGGVVALVVAYRRQNDIEQGRFVERFGAAASQLGHPDPAVRIAGVYAMAGVADESSTAHRRQQCIDVLCGYLRLPYDPQYGSSHHTEMTTAIKHFRPETTQFARIEEEHTDRRAVRQNDREVRQTIVRVIASHLQSGAENDWSNHDFDFKAVTFEDAAFDGCVFSGALTRFGGAKFSGSTTFQRTRFHSPQTDFECSVFDGALKFDGSRFAGPTSFRNASFKGDTSFCPPHLRNPDGTVLVVPKLQTRFRDGASFDFATFQGSVHFGGVVFEKWVSFMNAEFVASEGYLRSVAFDYATFKGELAMFSAARFECDVSFYRSIFNSKRTHMDRVTFGAPVSFALATFNSEWTTFIKADFKNCYRASFDGVVFNGPVSSSWGDDPARLPDCITPHEWPANPRPPKLE